MGLLTPIDIIVLVSYLTGITVIGARFYRRRTDTQAYFLGDKGMKWLPVALSILAADTSAISYLGLPAWSFRENLRLNQSVFTYFLAIPLVIWIFVPTYSTGNLYTAYQYLERRFDLRVRLMTSMLFSAPQGSSCCCGYLRTSANDVPTGRGTTCILSFDHGAVDNILYNCWRH